MTVSDRLRNRALARLSLKRPKPIDEMDAALDTEAADLIDKLVEALEPFAHFADVISDTVKRDVRDDETVATCGRHGTPSYALIRYGDMLSARAALQRARKG